MRILLRAIVCWTATQCAYAGVLFDTGALIRRSTASGDIHSTGATTTISWRNDIREQVSLNWIAPITYVYTNANVYVVGAGKRGFDPRESCLFFYAGTNRTAQFSAVELFALLGIETRLELAPTCHLEVYPDLVKNAQTHVGVAIGAGAILVFDIEKATLAEIVLKYESFRFSEWYKSMIREGSRRSACIIGEVVTVRSDMVFLKDGNDLTNNRHFREYVLRLEGKRPEGMPKAGETWAFHCDVLGHVPKGKYAEMIVFPPKPIWAGK